MNATLLLFSALGVLAVTLIARAMGFAATPALDDVRARAEAERIPGFRATRVRLAADARSALVEGTGGRLAAVLPLGDRFVARAVDPARMRAAGEDAILVDFAEPLLARWQFRFGAPGREPAA